LVRAAELAGVALRELVQKALTVFSSARSAFAASARSAQRWPSLVLHQYLI
jgi:hypothetical protein